MRRFWIAPLGIIASLISVALIVQQLRSTIDVFELADPTGNFGIYFFLGGLAAKLAVLFVAVCVLLPRSQSNVSWASPWSWLTKLCSISRVPKLRWLGT